MAKFHCDIYFIISSCSTFCTLQRDHSTPVYLLAYKSAAHTFRATFLKAKLAFKENKCLLRQIHFIWLLLLVKKGKNCIAWEMPCYIINLWTMLMR